MGKCQITPETPTVRFAADQVVLAAAAALEIFHLCDQTLPLWTQKCQRSQFRFLLLKAGHSSLGLHWKPSSHSPAKLFSHFHPYSKHLHPYSKHRFPLRHTLYQLSLRPTLPILGSTTSWHRGSPVVPGRQGILPFACSATQPHIHLQMSNIVWMSIKMGMLRYSLGFF